MFNYNYNFLTLFDKDSRHEKAGENSINRDQPQKKRSRLLHREKSESYSSSKSLPRSIGLAKFKEVLELESLERVKLFS